MVANRTDLKTRVREEARRLGFSKFGVATACSLPNGERLQRWLRAGMNGRLAYLGRQITRRLDPGLVLEGARSVLVLALSYHSAINTPGSPLSGNISRYARGEDYHAIMGDMLESLLASIKGMVPSVRGRCYVDTGPVMEKAWGARAAVGWMGKNTLLLSRDLGSWFFIGIILLDLELEPDQPREDSCGHCDRCIQACPSGAIVAPYLLDVRRCVSYLTQLRGPIPRAMRPLMGNRIFGCDVCQEVCPWNEGALETSEGVSRPGEETLQPDLAPLAGLSVGEFRRRFGNRPVFRATRDGFVRNVAIALGNSGRSEAIPALEGALRDSSPLVRGHAAWALGRIADPRVPQILMGARELETDPSVLEEIALASTPTGTPAI